ncbi:amino acid/polyamine/organocation transporter (APC superfamily) [Kushneria sinocarnis]|uniref:Amino acid/polyamine/organocation transporter (APC superfamily) n=1 Tax=Kushneria sinocarnis TaxID=595502 RepID=A0A420WU12_9GAMM|nr:APC family permease [Kushneria sinocarnis]RKQ96932.1 amino acid/polyamine/organocation transporter (APC superfamily) [Kushneria sinocarnis]
MTTPEAAEPPAQGAGPRGALRVRDGIAIMVGVVIGVGIFRTPPLVAAYAGSEWLFLASWLIGGIITLLGAMCYAELASSYPHAGGEYHFLSRAFGRRMATLFGWARGVVIQTGAIAAVAFVFGDYATRLLPLGEHGAGWYAALAIALLTLLHLRGTRQGGLAQRWLTLLTLMACLMVILAGWHHGGLAASLPVGTVRPALPELEFPALGMAMVFVLLTFGGWNEAAYLSADMRDPGRSMVRVLLLGTLILVLLYGAINLAYLSVLGLEDLRSSEAVADEMMRRAMGEGGAMILTPVILVASLSTLNATLFTGARVYYALGRDLPLLRYLGRWNARGDHPARGLIVQAVMALLLVLIGSASRDGFQAMVDYTAPVFWFFLMMVGIALIVLRRSEPAHPRPFRVPGYPLVPLLFCLVCAGLVYSSLQHAGSGGLLGIAIVALGCPLLIRWRTPASS